MKSQFLICLLPLFLLASGSCTNKKVLVQNRVSTQYMDGKEEKTWKGAEATKKIPLKLLRVLVADGTDTETGSPYKDPLQLRIYNNHPVGTDTLIESLYYNELVLKAFKESLPGKADIRVLTKKVCKEVLDSLVRADKVDLVITAQQIEFDYQFSSTGIENMTKNPTKKTLGVQVGSSTLINTGTTGTPPREAGYMNAITGGAPFNFSSERRQMPLVTRTITYRTGWKLQWIAPNPSKDNGTAQHQLNQEGILTDRLNYAEIVCSSAATQAGQSLARVFGW